MTRRIVAAAGATALAVGALVALSAHAGNRFAYEPPAPETMRAFQYASMSERLCLAELRERRVPFARVARAPGVATPIRLTGRVRGVRYRLSHRDDLDPKSAATVLDCRLALAIDDMSAVFARHGVVDVEYLSMYRPGSSHARRPGVRHPAGRAIDVATATLRDGTTFSVHHHFFGRVGAQTCGAGATPPRRPHPGAAFWRRVVCDLDQRHAFNLVLSPNYDHGHRDHLHLEVRSGIRWFLTQ